jgi:intergrase/recombinase
VKLTQNLENLQAEKHNGFCTVTLGYFRRSKIAYLGFITDYTIRLLREVEKQLKYETVRGSVRKRLGKHIVRYKYLRKFVNDVMTSEALSIPESVVDFIQGRTPKTVGALHYINYIV